MISVNRLVSIFSFKSILDYRHLSKRIVINADGKDVPKERKKLQKITLIGADNSVIVSDLNSAQNVSLRRDLKLVKVNDTDLKSMRPVYKLMMPADYHQEELQNRKDRQEARKSKNIKGDKLITLSAQVGEHDLMTGVRKMMKLLEKHYEVKVVITGQDNDTNNCERISTVIENNTKSVGTLVQKRFKGTNLKFQLIPIREKHLSSGERDSAPPNSEKDEKGPL